MARLLCGLADPHAAKELGPTWLRVDQLDSFKRLGAIGCCQINRLLGFVVGECDGKSRYFRPLKSLVVLVFEVRRGEQYGLGPFAGDFASMIKVSEVISRAIELAINI